MATADKKLNEVLIDVRGLRKQFGALLHVDCGLMQSLTAHIAEEHGFALDPRETVLVGVCARCSGMKKEEETCDGTDHTEGCHHCL